MKVKIEGRVIDFNLILQSAMKPGDICLVSTDGRLIVGRYYQDADGVGWLVRSDYAIKFNSKEESE